MSLSPELPFCALRDGRRGGCPFIGTADICLPLSLARGDREALSSGSPGMRELSGSLLQSSEASPCSNVSLHAQPADSWGWGGVRLLPRSVPLGKFKGQPRARGSPVASCPAGSRPSQPAFLFLDLSFSIRKMGVVVVVMWI